LIALAWFDMAEQSGLLVYICRTKEPTFLVELHSPRLDLGEAIEMAVNYENHPLKEFFALKIIKIQISYTMSNMKANNFELKHALSTHIQ
jgi:hypothetical protein